MDEQPTRIYEIGDEKAWTDIVDNGPPPPAAPAATAVRRRARTLATGAGLVLGGVLLGTVAVSAAQGLGGTPRTTAAQTQGAPSLEDQQGPDASGRGGGLDGEQRLSGTVASVSGSSVSVTTGSGTASYAVTAQTEIVKDGQPVALSALKPGDAVFLHVYPSGSGMAAERIFAGNLPAGGPGFGRNT